jgi:Rod binding domain-containing protein
METSLLPNVTDMNAMRLQNATANTSRELSKVKLAGKGVSPEKVDEVATEFEAQFISQMLENMFSTVDTKGFLGGGEAEETYRSMMVDEYGKLIARSGGIGVADHVKREMLRLQEANHDAT